MSAKGVEVEVAPDVTFNGDWYTVTTPNGGTWSMDEDDIDEQYAISALHAWSRWLDYVRIRNDS